MKKVLLSLFSAVVCLPMAFGQVTAGHTLEHLVETACSPYTWALTGETYTNDTTVLYTHGDTIYVLDFTRTVGGVDTAQARVLSGDCEVVWNGKSWTMPGTYIDTIAMPGGCDSLVKVSVELQLTAMTNQTVVACDTYDAPWGETLTESVNTIHEATMANGCVRIDTLNLTINHSVEMPQESATGDCSYSWNGMTIVDGNVHKDTLTSANGCDSIVSIAVTLSGVRHDTLNVTECELYVAPWGDTLMASGTTEDTAVNGACTEITTLVLTINPVYKDTASLVVTDISAGCYFEFGDSVFTDTNIVHTAMIKSVAGCDSLASIRIVSYSGMEYDSVEVKNCGRYTWRGHNYTAAGVYTDSVTDTTTGCTTISKLNLTLADNYDTLKISACDSYTRTLDDRGGNPLLTYTFTVTESGIYVTDTNYTDNLFPDSNLYSYDNQKNCYTHYIFDVNILKPEQRYRPDIDTVACDKYSIKLGSTTTSFTTDTVVTLKSTRHIGTNSADQCYDSIAHITLQVNKSTYHRDTVSVCDSYTWAFNGETYTSSTTTTATLYDTVYNIIDTTVTVDTITGMTDSIINYDTVISVMHNAVGCDSIGQLKLTVKPSPQMRIVGDWILEPGQTTVLHAVCDNGINANQLRYQWYVDGTSRGTADSLEVTAPGDMSSNSNVEVQLKTKAGSCESENWITITSNDMGVESVEAVDVNVYPNPAARIVNLSCDEVLSEVVVFNSLGQVALQQSPNANRVQLNLGMLTNGHYTMRITAANGEQITRKLIVNK